MKKLNNLWYAGAIITSIGIAWVAARLHIAGFAPVGIISLGVGISIGAFVLWAGNGLTTTWRTRLVVAAGLALLCALAEHAWLYYDFRGEWHEACLEDPRLALFRSKEPSSPYEYFRRELTPTRAALWMLDVTLIMAGAVGTIFMDRRESDPTTQK